MTNCHGEWLAFFRILAVLPLCLPVVGIWLHSFWPRVPHTHKEKP